MAYKTPNKNILGNWELFTYDINNYSFEKQNKIQEQEDIPYVSSNIGFRINEKDSYNHISNNNVENDSGKRLENTVRQNDERLTKGRTKQ